MTTNKTVVATYSVNCAEERLKMHTGREPYPRPKRHNGWERRVRPCRWKNKPKIAQHLEQRRQLEELQHDRSPPFQTVDYQSALF